MMYAGIRFTGFTDITIKGNRFDKKSKAESIHYRENGATLVNAYSYKNTKDVLDLNKSVVVTENTFTIADPKTKAIRIAKDSAEYLGKVTDITVTNNTIRNTSENPEQPNIQMTRISDRLNVSGNTINGGKEGIVVENSTGHISILNNILSNLFGNAVSLFHVGDNEMISIITKEAGNLDVMTEDGKYHLVARNTSTHSYEATYLDENLANLVDKDGMILVPISQGESFDRFLKFRVTLQKIEGDEPSNNSTSSIVELTKGSNKANTNEKISKKQEMLPQTGTNKVMELVMTLLGVTLLVGLQVRKGQQKN